MAVVGVLLSYGSPSLKATEIISIRLVEPDPYPEIDCELGSIFMKAGPGHAVTVNGTNIGAQLLPSYLEKILERKVERIV